MSSPQTANAPFQLHARRCFFSVHSVVVFFLKAADSNLVTALDNSTFTLKEKIAFFKKKWLKEHIATIALCVVAWIGIIVWTAQKLRGSDAYQLLGAIGSMLAILFYVVLRNRMMIYVEDHAYRATPDKENETKNA